MKSDTINEFDLTPEEWEMFFKIIEFKSNESRTIAELDELGANTMDQIIRMRNFQ